MSLAILWIAILWCSFRRSALGKLALGSIALWTPALECTPPGALPEEGGRAVADCRKVVAAIFRHALGKTALVQECGFGANGAQPWVLQFCKLQIFN